MKPSSGDTNLYYITFTVPISISDSEFRMLFDSTYSKIPGFLREENPKP